jgi:2-C-methyl-D-erythritol 4-phosphate cytidylyltransferase
VWGILVAGGSGARFGKAKQFEHLAGKTVLQWSLEHLEAAVDGVVVVLPASKVDEWSGRHVAVAGGDTRSASVRAGLAHVPLDAKVVLIHDAARPFATSALAKLAIGAIVDGVDAAIPGRPVSDTIKRVDVRGQALHVRETVDRSDLYAVQTPQAFRAEVLRRAHAGEPNASDDAALVESMGGNVVIIPGESRNMKITVADDLAVAQVLIAQ